MTDLASLGGGATAYVVDALYLRHPGLAARFGERGRAACRADTGHHLDHLRAALECGEGHLFVDYAAWLADVLRGRNVPVDHLVESFVLLADYLNRHLAAPDAAAAAAILADAAAAVGQPASDRFAHLPAALTESGDYGRLALSGDHLAAQSLVDRIQRAGHDYADLGVHLIQPAMYQVGHLWQQNRITVAQEHLATAVTQNVLVRAYMQAEFAAGNGRKALFACVEGNQHSLGLRMLADSFEIHGWEIAYLGADVPTNDLLRHVDTWRPDLLALSISLPRQIATARATIERLRGELAGRAPAILVGGLTTNASTQLWRNLGADGWAADAIDALRQAGH